MSTDLHHVGAEYAANQRARKLRLFSIRSEAQSANIQRLTPEERERQAAARYEQRRARIQADIERHRSQTAARLSAQDRPQKKDQ